MICSLKQNLYAFLARVFPLVKLSWGFKEELQGAHKSLRKKILSLCTYVYLEGWGDLVHGFFPPQFLDRSIRSNNAIVILDMKTFGFYLQKHPEFVLIPRAAISLLGSSAGWCRYLFFLSQKFVSVVGPGQVYC